MPSDTYYFRTVVFVYLAAAAATGAASLLVMGCGIDIIVRFGSLYTENKYYQTLLYCNLWCIITCFVEFYTVVMLLKLQKLLQKLDGTECTRSHYLQSWEDASHGIHRMVAPMLDSWCPCHFTYERMGVYPP